ncbi:MAG: hypothetical protein IIT82_04705 [Selenomonas sp.]|nr:hypothetical protein [Selenomonas sp.]
MVVETAQLTGITRGFAEDFFLCKTSFLFSEQGGKRRFIDLLMMIDMLKG